MNLKPLWTIAKGGAKYAIAHATGDVAPEPVRELRAQICRDCPSRVRTKVLGADGPSDWCGQPFIETSQTCGCLLPAKISVASESCPQLRWLPVERERADD